MTLILQTKRVEPAPTPPAKAVVQYRLDAMYDDLNFVWRVIEEALAHAVLYPGGVTVKFLLDNGDAADILFALGMTISVIDDQIARPTP
jgi:hypothetical protein